MRTLYHYTNRAGKDGILNAGRFKMSTLDSTQGDVILGEGVYFTEMEPSLGKEAILKNSYGTFDWKKFSDRADFVFAVEFTEEDIKNKNIFKKGTQAGRNVWLYKGRDVVLAYYTYTVERVTRD